MVVDCVAVAVAAGEQGEEEPEESEEKAEEAEVADEAARGVSETCAEPKAVDAPSLSPQRSWAAGASASEAQKPPTGLARYFNRKAQCDDVPTSWHACIFV